MRFLFIYFYFYYTMLISHTAIQSVAQEYYLFIYIIYLLLSI